MGWERIDGVELGAGIITRIAVGMACPEAWDGLNIQNASQINKHKQRAVTTEPTAIHKFNLVAGLDLFIFSLNFIQKSGHPISDKEHLVLPALIIS